MPLNWIIRLLLLTVLLPAIATAVAPALEDQSLAQLEQRLVETDTELGQLAKYSLRGDTGSPGYRSQGHPHPDAVEWIRVELDAAALLDQIVLVPILYRDSENGLRAEGFPPEFRILAGTDDSSTVIATFSEDDHLLPRIAPLAVSFPPIRASWIRIETITLAPHNWGKQYFLQLAEVMVFSGEENVALGSPVDVPTPSRSGGSRNARYLADGFSPYLMNAAQGPQSKTLLITVDSPEPPPSLTIDLQTPQPVNQINLHAANLSQSIPVTEFAYRAVPRHVRILGAKHADFSDQTILCEYEQHTIYDNGPIIMLRFPETTSRYIQIVILDPQPVVSFGNQTSDIAFSEIEVLSHSHNVALGATLSASAGLTINNRNTLLRITDGLNYYGEILPLRDWMNQLARRHDLERERPLVTAELSQRYARQKANLRRMTWLAVLLVAGTVILILAERLNHLRQMAKMRNRFAADLHDELGANIHTIGLLSDAANSPQSTTDERDMLHQRIRNLTEQTGTAIRHISNMANADNLYLGLVKDMQRASQRILAKTEHQLDIEGDTYLDRLPPRTRIDLFLFYKEALINIGRHSGATQVSTQLTATNREIVLTIIDNGKGLTEGNIPSSLQRRAKMLKSKLLVEHLESGGTKISLTLRTRARLLQR